MTKKGYVTRPVIEKAITNELVRLGEGINKAKSKARNCISDYKKELLKTTDSTLALNLNIREKEQYKTQELGEWLYRRKGKLKDFRTPCCPFKANFSVSITENINLDDGSIGLNGEEVSDPILAIKNLLNQSIHDRRLIAQLKAENTRLLNKKQSTREKKSAAGKLGSRTKQAWYSAIVK
jgi:hypothetical protein